MVCSSCQSFPLADFCYVSSSAFSPFPSKRELKEHGSLPFDFRIMIFILILALLTEIKGATFFLHYNNDNKELFCNSSAHHNQTGWWYGSDCSSLLTFQRMKCNRGGDPFNCSGKENTHDQDCTSQNISITTFRHGGIFACKALMDSKMSGDVPLFNKDDHCRNYDFFIVAIMKREADEKIESIIHNQTITVKETSNFSLPCEFKLNPTTAIFAVYWIKQTDESTCLLSVSNDDSHSLHNFSYDINCCVDNDIKKRRLNNSDPSGQNQSHEITIVNVTTSDSGVYFCVATVHLMGHFWKIVTNVSVKVVDPQEDKPEHEFNSANNVPISLGVVGIIILIGGIILFLCWKKNSKGKPSEPQQRDRTTTEMEGDDCSPYAITSRNDVHGNEAVYSLAMMPGVNPNGGSSTLDGKSTSGMQAGEKVETLYAVVNKG